MVRYRYDGWGNHVVLNPNGSKNESDTFIGNINPFRYRGYYYDVETGLYYLKTRYYDPEVGRFITIDDISYLAPDTINGLNLYAYCGNNPVMRIDENGNAWWHWVIGALVVVSVAVATAVTAGTIAVLLGASSVLAGSITSSALLSGLLVGGVNLFAQWGAGAEMPNIKELTVNTILGGVAGALSGGANLFVKGATIAVQIGKQVGINVAISLGSYAFQSLINKETLTFEGIVIAIGSGVISGLTFNQPLISSGVVSIVTEMIGYAWENIKNIWREYR